jgi:hypothetical protein
LTSSVILLTLSRMHSKMSKPVAFIVHVDLPRNVSVLRMQQYILGEVQAGIGQLSPMDPLFDLDRSSVKVERIRLPGADSEAK